MKLFHSLRSEMQKTRRTASFYLTLATAAIVPLIFLLDVCSDGVKAKDRNDFFNILFQEGFSMTSFLIFPMLIILICTLLPQLEHKNHTWKQVFASPQTKANIFFAKFLNVQFFLLLFLGIHTVFMLITALAIHFAIPSLQLFRLPFNSGAMMMKVLNTYLSLMAVTSLQFWLGLRLRNFIVPIAVGLSGWLFGALMVREFHSSYAVYFPYSLHMFSASHQPNPQLLAVLWTSICYTVVFTFAGFLDFRRKQLSA